MVKDQSQDVAIVDDDAAILDSFQFMLELAGFEVTTYSSASAYLERGGTQPRCLILDQHMPLMTGLELAARLRTAGIQVPVMLITSAPSLALVARAAEIGVEHVLEKPLAERDLIDFVVACR